MSDDDSLDFEEDIIVNETLLLPNMNHLSQLEDGEISNDDSFNDNDQIEKEKKKSTRYSAFSNIVNPTDKYWNYLKDNSKQNIPKIPKTVNPQVKVPQIPTPSPNLLINSLLAATLLENQMKLPPTHPLRRKVEVPEFNTIENNQVDDDDQTETISNTTEHILTTTSPNTTTSSKIDSHNTKSKKNRSPSNSSSNSLSASAPLKALKKKKFDCVESAIQAISAATSQYKKEKKNKWNNRLKDMTKNYLKTESSLNHNKQTYKSRRHYKEESHRPSRDKRRRHRYHESDRSNSTDNYSSASISSTEDRHNFDQKLNNNSNLIGNKRKLNERKRQQRHNSFDSNNSEVNEKETKIKERKDDEEDINDKSSINSDDLIRLKPIDRNQSN
ncbi:hypothetical protein SNEBB_010749 [Seison nebaliae]|nr:hypothetical protein SNEBB_010749 [Seison nebaliae]